MPQHKTIFKIFYFQIRAGRNVGGRATSIHNCTGGGATDGADDRTSGVVAALQIKPGEKGGCFSCVRSAVSAAMVQQLLLRSCLVLLVLTSSLLVPPSGATRVRCMLAP